MSQSPPVHDFSQTTTLAPDVALVPAPVRVPKVFIGLCSRDWQVESHTSESVRAMGQRCKCEIDVRYMMNDGVARSRNNLLAQFIESDCTHLFFLDSDIIMEPWQLDRLLEANKPLIGALYPKKQPTLEWVVNYLPNSKGSDAEGRMSVKHIGNGAWLWRREEIVAHIEKHPEIKYGGDPSPESVRYDLFPMHAKDGRYLSEDWAACERWIADGNEVWVDTKVQLRHIGKIVYPLQFTLSDEDVVDLVFHRYGIAHDLVRTFISSGPKSPGLWGGHRQRMVRLWPKDMAVSDLHQGDVLAGCYDLPGELDAEKAPTILDIGADAGAFVRWAQKRWKGPAIHSYEARPERMTLLQQTIKGLVDAGTKAKLEAHGEIVAGSAFAELPKANILKIDLPEREREVIDAMHYAGRLPEFEAIVIRYSDETGAFLIGKIIQQTHIMHCNQRFTDTTGIMKFIRRDLVVVEPEPTENK